MTDRPTTKSAKKARVGSTLETVKDAVQNHPKDAAQLETAVDKLTTAAGKKSLTDKKELKTFTDGAVRNSEEQTNQAFHEWYVQQVTKCFGEEIDGLRKSSDAFGGSAEDLSSLIVALRTGESLAVFEQAAKTAVVHAIKAEKKKKKAKN